MEHSIQRFTRQELAKMDGAKLVQEIDRMVRGIYKRACSAKHEDGTPDLPARKEASQQLDEYLNEQMAMFSARGQNPQRALKEAIVATGEYLKRKDGSEVEIMRIVKRGFTLELAPEDEGIHVASVANSVLYSQAMGMGREQSRGKYNDAGLLIEQSAASVDASEVVPFAQVSL